MSNKILVTFDALKIEGGLFASDFLGKISHLSAPFQTESDYAVPSGLKLREYLFQKWRISLSLYTAWSAGGSQTNFLNSMLTDVLGFKIGKNDENPICLNGRTFPLSGFLNDGAVSFLRSDLLHGFDKGFQEYGEEGRKRSPHNCLQEWLNLSENSVWGILTNGHCWRLLRDNPSMTKMAYIEVDLKTIFENENFAEFALFWLLFSSTRFGIDEFTHKNCILEKWKKISLQDGERALDNLRDGVGIALRFLGQGFIEHPANLELRKNLQSGEISPQLYYEQILRLIYRFILLLKTEDADLLHTVTSNKSAKDLYYNAYSLSRLRERSFKTSSYDKYSDIWSSLLVSFKALEKGEDALGLPALGGLFKSTHCSALHSSFIANKFLLAAIRNLSYFSKDESVVKINYRDMGTEELGSVYESLLELIPQVDQSSSPWIFKFLGDDIVDSSSQGSQRKLTGSYYTPDILVQELLESSLRPLINEKLSSVDDDETIKNLLSIKICDPACGSGHFLISAARVLTNELVKIRFKEGYSPDDYRSSLRDVINNCIYGVDLNPMTVELCKVALWLESFEPGKPLSFLDSKIKCGNALIGTRFSKIRQGLPEETYSATDFDDSTLAKELSRTLKRELRTSQPSLFDVTNVQIPTFESSIKKFDTLSDVEAIEKEYDQFLKGESFEKLSFLFDLWCSIILSPKNRDYDLLMLSDLQFRNILSETLHDLSLASKYFPKVKELRDRFKFFHWEIEFPDVFQLDKILLAPSSICGFDCVLANPPWEKINFKDEEFFATNYPEISSASNKAKRKAMIEALRVENPAYYLYYQNTKEVHDKWSHFLRNSTLYPYTGLSRINLYSTFAELISGLLSQSGIAGMVVQSGIATDDNNKDFFQMLMRGRKVRHVWDFENKGRAFFDIDSRTKFSLFSFCGEGRVVDAPDFAFYLTSLEDLKKQSKHFSINLGELELLNPGSMTVPTFRSRDDVDFTLRVYKLCPPWSQHIQSEGYPAIPRTPFNASNDSASFVNYEEIPSATKSELVELYESKYMNQFDDRFATILGASGSEPRELTKVEKEDFNYSIVTKYWVKRSVLEQRFNGNWFLVLRDITNPTNARTSICTLLPKVACSNTLHVLDTQGNLNSALILCGILNSFVFDFFARQKIAGVHFNHYIYKQLPFPRFEKFKLELSFQGEKASIEKLIKKRVAKLLATSPRLCDLLQVEYGPENVDGEARMKIRDELDAIYMWLYGISNFELFEKVMNGFPGISQSEISQHGVFKRKEIIWENLNSILLSNGCCE